MRIALYQDATIEIQLEDFASLIGEHLSHVTLDVGAAKFEVASGDVSWPTAYQQLPRRLREEVQHFDLALMLTAKPYDNNYFYEMHSNQAIISFWGWESLTDLPIENGVAYFLASKIIDQLGFGFDHDENVGCINDFWWDKTGVDAGMRAAFMCSRCRERLPPTPPHDVEEVPREVDWPRYVTHATVCRVAGVQRLGYTARHALSGQRQSEWREERRRRPRTRSASRYRSGARLSEEGRPHTRRTPIVKAMSDGRAVVDEIRQKHPEWLDAVAACLRAVNESASPDRRFLGSVARLYLTSPRPNFSPLVTWGLLEVLDRSRRNTSYRFVDEAGARQGMEPVRRG